LMLRIIIGTEQVVYRKSFDSELDPFLDAHKR